MVRRLKTYQTSLGFFDLAIAAPSMKAAAEAWSLKTEEFRRGFAKETHDPAIVAATVAKPGIVLRRPVGSHGPFSEHAELPKDLPMGKIKEEPAKTRRNAKEPKDPRLDEKAAQAERVLEAAKREHENKTKKIETDRAALDRRSQAEEARWEKQKEKLETALRRARD
jgi:colicin import membrane protein